LVISNMIDPIGIPDHHKEDDNVFSIISLNYTIN